MFGEHEYLSEEVLDEYADSIDTIAKKYSDCQNVQQCCLRLKDNIGEYRRTTKTTESLIRFLMGIAFLIREEQERSARIAEEWKDEAEELKRREHILSKKRSALAHESNGVREITYEVSSALRKQYGGHIQSTVFMSILKDNAKL
jgi:hypothetical protein